MPADPKADRPHGIYGIPAEAVADIFVTGGPAAVADRISSLQSALLG